MGAGYSVLGTSQWLMTGNKWFGAAGFRTNAAKFNPADLNVDLSSKVCLVTGANAGLGKETALALAAKGAELHMLCRNRERGEEALREITATAKRPDAVHLHVVDVSSRAQVKSFCEQWITSGKPIDSLVLNAGVLLPKREETPEGIESTLATMVMQSYLMTGLLAPAMRQASQQTTTGRVIHVSSGGQYTMAMDLDDPQAKGVSRKYDGAMQYAVAKKMQVVLSEMWAEKFGGKIVSVSMHPGWSDTPGVQRSLKDFREKNKETLRTPEQGADSIIWLAASPAATAQAVNGKFIFDREAVKTDFWGARTAPSESDKAALWRLCEEMCDWSYTGNTGSSAASGSSSAAQ